MIINCRNLLALTRLGSNLGAVTYMIWDVFSYHTMREEEEGGKRLVFIMGRPAATRVEGGGRTDHEGLSGRDKAPKGGRGGGGRQTTDLDSDSARAVGINRTVKGVALLLAY